MVKNNYQLTDKDGFCIITGTREEVFSYRKILVKKGLHKSGELIIENLYE